MQGLVSYPETHPGLFRHDEAIAEAGGKMRVLDLTCAEVRQADMEAKSGEALYKGAVGGDYP